MIEKNESLRLGADYQHRHGVELACVQAIEPPVHLLQKLNAECEKQRFGAVGRQVHAQADRRRFRVGNRQLAGGSHRVDAAAFHEIDLRSGRREHVMRGGRRHGHEPARRERRNLYRGRAGSAVDAAGNGGVQRGRHGAGGIEFKAFEKGQLAVEHCTVATPVGGIGLDDAAEQLRHAAAHPAVAYPVQHYAERVAQHFGGVAGPAELAPVFTGALESRVVQDAGRFHAPFGANAVTVFGFVKRQVTRGTLDGNDPFLLWHDDEILKCMVRALYVARPFWRCCTDQVQRNYHPKLAALKTTHKPPCRICRFLPESAELST